MESMHANYKSACKVKTCFEIRVLRIFDFKLQINMPPPPKRKQGWMKTKDNLLSMNANIRNRLDSTFRIPELVKEERNLYLHVKYTGTILHTPYREWACESI